MRVYLKTGTGADAFGDFNPDTEEIVILKDSKISKVINKNLGSQLDKVSEERKKYCDGFVVKQDMQKMSLSSASNFVTGNRSNGWKAWVDSDGKCLDDLYPDRPKKNTQVNQGLGDNEIEDDSNDDFNSFTDDDNSVSLDDNSVSLDDICDKYLKNDFLNEVYITEDHYDSLVAVLRNKKNIILQGPPGVGKTFAAKRLAWSMMGEKDNTRIEFVQFHQNYSYEDFIMRYKPAENGFKLKKSVFYRFCKQAEAEGKSAEAEGHFPKDFFFIIDEINRGNMSKIFGELLMLIEKDYRGEPITLGYNKKPFLVPQNLYIIGMMNTADRSLAMIDYALRRRFSFFDMEPGFESDGFKRYLNNLNNKNLNNLIEKVKELNEEISKSLGKGFCIGHSYFCGCGDCTDTWLHSIVNFDILPMLREYWFDNDDLYNRWELKLKEVFK